MATIKPPPAQDRVSEASTSQAGGQRGLISRPWLEWLEDLTKALDKAPKRIASVTLEDQQASIAATDFTGTTIAAGYYRISYYARITQAATSSSSLTVTFDWTDGGVNPSYSGAAITGNTTATVQSGTLMVRADGASAINYATTYSSTGATAMAYRLDIYLEELPT